MREEPRAVPARVHHLPVLRQHFLQRLDHVAEVEQPRLDVQGHAPGSMSKVMLSGLESRTRAAMASLRHICLRAGCAEVSASLARTSYTGGLALVYMAAELIARQFTIRLATIAKRSSPG